MSAGRGFERSERWLRLLLRLYPADFRDECGEALVETYLDRCRAAFQRGGVPALALLWLRALADSLYNGLGERARPAIAWRRSGNWGRDAERALRRLVRAPVFALTMIATLTVGLGAFAVVYTVVDTVLLRPLPYDEPDDLYFVWRDYGWFDLKRGWLSGPDVAALHTAGGVIAGAAALDRDNATLASAASGAAGDPEEIGVMSTTPNLFPLLGVRPLLGRGFAPEEVGPGRPAVLVLTHKLWQRRFGGDAAVVGREVRLNGQPFTVIGVMGPDFDLVRNGSVESPEGADAYTTLDADIATMDNGGGSFAGIVRARPGASPAAVGAAVGAVGRMVDRRDFESRGLRLYPVGMEADLVARVRPALVVLGASGVLLVLVLAVNMANLLLVRAGQRDQEFAVSRALGANPLALARATLLEAGLLGMLGGVCGALVATWATRALVALTPLDLPRRESIAVDLRIALLVVGVGTLLGLLAGAAPAMWATRTQLAALLRNAAVRGGGGGQGRLRRAMVVTQVALSLVLLTAGGLVVRSFERLLRADPGFDPAGVLTLRVPAIPARYPNDTAVVALHERVERELAALPGVTVVGGATALPLTADANQRTIAFPGAPGNTGNDDHDAPLVDVMSARAGYFAALGIPVVAGRGFSTGAGAGVREALIDRTLADYFFPTGSPVGFRLPIPGDTLTIVGVVEHARQYDIHADGRPQLYVRDEYDPDRGLSFAIRTERDPMSLVPEVRAAVRRVDPQLAVAELRPMDELMKQALRQPRVSAVLISGFSLGALLLAAMGLFGVVAGSVNRRRHEIAVRLALGAGHGRVLRLVLGEGAVLVALGLAVGVPGIYVAGRILRGVLVGVSPFDPATLVAVVAGLAAVALLACYVPARRVATIEPAQAFRDA